MRYLVKARMKAGQERALARALADGSLGRGSIAGDEYQRCLEAARVDATGLGRWVEVCYCATPLEEERPYWEEYFELVQIKDAHARRKCRDENGTEPWACGDCDCTARLEQRLSAAGAPFLDCLNNDLAGGAPLDD